MTEAPTLEGYAKSLDELRQLKKPYQACFNTLAGEEVLKDLLPFCRAFVSEWSDDQRHHARYSGRREVAIHILQLLELPTSTLYKIYGGIEPGRKLGDDE